MEKIIVVMQGHEWAQNVVDFACYLSLEDRSRIDAYFVEEPGYATLPRVGNIAGFTYVEPIVAADIPEVQAEREFTGRRMENFLGHCTGLGIIATASRVSADMLETVLKQTRFADLLVIDAAAVAGHQPPDSIPSPLVQRMLSESQCPVVIAPVSYMHPEEAIFCYDGSPSSIFAMKQFAYVFPEFSGLKATAVRVGNEENDDAEAVHALTTWMSRRFAFNEYVSLRGTIENDLYPFVLKHNRPIVVMGAYGRSALSRFFSRSSADYFIETLSCPIFITHAK